MKTAPSSNRDTTTKMILLSLYDKESEDEEVTNNFVIRLDVSSDDKNILKAIEFENLVRSKETNEVIRGERDKITKRGDGNIVDDLMLDQMGFIEGKYKRHNLIALSTTSDYTLTSVHLNKCGHIHVPYQFKINSDKIIIYPSGDYDCFYMLYNGNYTSIPFIERCTVIKLLFYSMMTGFKRTGFTSIEEIKEYLENV